LTPVTSVVTVAEFHCEAGEIQYILHPNGHPKRIFLYVVRQIEVEPLKIGHDFTK